MVIAALINAQGFEYVKARVAPVRQCDIALMAAFGSGALAEIGNVTAWLAADIAEL